MRARQSLRVGTVSASNHMGDMADWKTLTRPSCSPRRFAAAAGTGGYDGAMVGASARRPRVPAPHLRNAVACPAAAGHSATLRRVHLWPSSRHVTTRRGIEAKVHTRGNGPPLVWFHGAGGLFPIEPMLDLVAEQHTIHAAEWPGFGDEQTEGYLEDMLDFTLHGWDLVDAMALGETPDVAGHSMGGMIAAEMAAVNPGGIGSLVLVGAAGLWIDEHPVPDIFSMLPFELAEVLFADPVVGEAILTAGLDFSARRALTNSSCVTRGGSACRKLLAVPTRALQALYRSPPRRAAVWEHDHSSAGVRRAVPDCSCRQRPTSIRRGRRPSSPTQPELPPAPLSLPVLTHPHP